MEDNKKPSKKPSKPIKMIAKFFNKSKRTTSNCPEVSSREDQPIQPQTDDNDLEGPQLSDLAIVDTELEALHISRTDNPYLQILSSQDHLDNTASDENNRPALMSPESISPSHSGKDYSLTEIHARLVRSPPPISWPLSPRSNGTFSPDDSSDMDLDNTPSVTMQPTRGYSPYNRSQSEEHILSPCRELIKSTEFSPVRGTTPELLGISVTSDGSCMSPYRDYDLRSERTERTERKMRASVGRTASFMSTSTGSRPQPLGGPSLKYSRAISYNRSSNFYYTMNYSQDEDLDEALLSPNRNQYSFGTRASRRSIGGLSLSPMSMSMVGGTNSSSGGGAGNKYANFFSSWRRSYRFRSKSSSSSAHKNNGTRKKDTKSLENLLDDDRPERPRFSLDCEDEQDMDEQDDDK